MNLFGSGLALETILTSEMPALPRAAGHFQKNHKGDGMAAQENDLIGPVCEDDHVQGWHQAPVTLVQYGNYICPKTAQAHSVVEQLAVRFGATLRIVFRHFIGSQADAAQLAAEAAEAAGARGRFWPMHKRLLQSQQLLEPGFLTWQAAAVGLDVGNFQRELNLRIHAHRVLDHETSARRSGVRQTPTFFINGRRHEGSHDVHALSLSVREALNRPAPAIAQV